MRITICWTNISGYMAACWRELAKQQGVELFIIAWKSDSPGSTISFGEDLLAGLNFRLLDSSEYDDPNFVREMVFESKPDVVVMSGLFHIPYTLLVHEPGLQKTKFVMAIDTPRRDTLRQKLGKYARGGFLKRLDGVIVAGERSFQLAKLLGIPERKICRGVYGFDEPIFAAVRTQRSAQPWPKKFLFVGRYVEDKAIDVLVDAYRAYRASVPDPWPLTCVGKGPMKHLLNTDGIDGRGFVHPNDLPNTLLEHGVYVIASRYEPWGVAIAEALSSGMPVICTEACGASVELVRSQFNGLTVATNDVKALAAGFRWAHDRYDDLAGLGANGAALASAFSAKVWADRWLTFLKTLT